MPAGTRTLALVALLVVLAGCGGLAGESSPGPATTPASTTGGTTADATGTTTDPTTTPASAGPTAGVGGTTDDSDDGGTSSDTGAGTTTAEVAGLAPGIAEDGVTEPFALARAHADLLRNRSYAANATTVVRFENGSLARRTVETTHRDGESYLFAQRAAGPLRRTAFARTELRSDGTTTLAVIEWPNGNLTYDRLSAPAALVPDAGYWRNDVYGLVGSGEFSVETVPGGDRQRYRLVSDSIRPVAVENASVRMVLDDRGFVREYRYAYDRTEDGVATHAVRTVRFSGLGTTTVPRPPWVDSALNETTG